jgi:hypothetical protein
MATESVKRNDPPILFQIFWAGVRSGDREIARLARHQLLRDHGVRVQLDRKSWQPRGAQHA